MSEEPVSDLESLGVVGVADLGASGWVMVLATWRYQVDLMSPQARTDASVQKAAAKLSFRLPLPPQGVLTAPSPQPAIHAPQPMPSPRREGWIDKLLGRRGR